MKIYEFIDTCFNYKHNLTDLIRYELNKEFTEQQWIQAGIFFVTHLNKKHQIPGRVIETIMGICQWRIDTNPLSNEQKIYLSKKIIDYWDQLDPAEFIQLNL